MIGIWAVWENGVYLIPNTKNIERVIFIVRNSIRKESQNRMLTEI